MSLKDTSVYFFDEIDSTNSEARRRLLSGLALPALFIARRQTAGRGRRGRSFYSEGGLYMTLALPPQSAFDAVPITACAASATAMAIEELCGVKTGIKWVNDIFVSGKKVCGILAEAVTDPETGKALGLIIGVGVNLNNAIPEELEGIACSIICPDLSPETLAKAITDKMLAAFSNKQAYMAYYRTHSMVLGQKVRYIQNDVTYDAVALDIDDMGGLKVLHPDGTTQTLTSGEVTLRIKTDG